MRILVTGGAGFIGSHTVDALVASGAGDVSVLDDLSAGKRKQVNAKATFYQTDLRDARGSCVRRSSRRAPRLSSISRRRWTCGVRSPILRSTRK